MADRDGVDAMYMDNLDEFINDENKVVTYRWLSTTLQVHVNQAKQMLYNFVMHQRNKNDNDDLNITYFIAGLRKNEHSAMIQCCDVVAEDQLNAIKSTFQKLYSCHIYSVQKSKIQESNALYITDYNLMKENIFDSCKQSSIKFNPAKWVVESKPVVQEKRVEVKPSFLDDDPKTKPSKPESNGRSETTVPKNNNAGKMGIAGMFAKANAKKESPKCDEPIPNTSKTETKETGKKNSAVSKKSPGVMSFFANSVAKSKPSEEKPKEVKKQSTVPDEKKNDKKRTVEKKKPASSDSDDDFVHQKKKRRRIKDNVFDSSSEEEMEAEEPLPSPPTVQEESKVGETKDEEKEDDGEVEDDEAPIPDTPEQKPKIESVKKEEPPSVTVTSDGRRRKRIRRKKKKTFIDDEGFMVSEMVMESDSTDASDVEAPSNKPAEQPKKVNPAAIAGKQKQSSLMSFFTKK